MLLCAVLPLAAHAAVQEIRVVGVGIDSSSKTAEAIALEYARKRAVFLATRKLGVPEPHKVVAKFKDADYRDIIRGANVTQSRRSGETTYLDVSVTLVDESLRRALKLPPAAEANPADYRMRGVLMLAAFVGKERLYLWEKDNLLRKPLTEEVRRMSRGRVLLPSGDLSDLRLIDYQNAMTVQPDELIPMFDRYGAEEIVIVALRLSDAGTEDASQVIIRRLKRDSARHEILTILPASMEEAVAIRLNKATTAIASAVTQIASATAEHDALLRAKAEKLHVRFSYTIPKDLARMQQAVLESPQVLFLDMPSIALARVGATIYLKGDAEALREELVRQGIIVTAINDGWRLSVR